MNLTRKIWTVIVVALIVALIPVFEAHAAKKKPYLTVVLYGSPVQAPVMMGGTLFLCDVWLSKAKEVFMDCELSPIQPKTKKPAAKKPATGSLSA